MTLIINLVAARVNKRVVEAGPVTVTWRIVAPVVGHQRTLVERNASQVDARILEEHAQVAVAVVLVAELTWDVLFVCVGDVQLAPCAPGRGRLGAELAEDAVVKVNDGGEGAEGDGEWVEEWVVSVVGAEDALVEGVQVVLVDVDLHG